MPGFSLLHRIHAYTFLLQIPFHSSSAVSETHTFTLYITMDFDEIDFEVFNAVDDSWNAIKKIPNHEEVAGEILFRKYVEFDSSI
jgi:hypothetical protein